MELDSKPVLTQKEYLKRYLSKDKNKKKKKKTKISSSSHLKRSVIIDDDLGLKDVATVDDDEFNLDYLGDEAPQIVGIVDERPTELRAKEKYDTNLWRTVGEKKEFENSAQESNKLSELAGSKINLNTGNVNDSDSDLSLPRPEKVQAEKFRKNAHNEKSENENFRALQKRKNGEKQNDSGLSPDRSRDRKKKESSSDSDMSPPRSSKFRKNTSYKEREVNALKNKRDRTERDWKPRKENNDNHYKARRKSYSDEESDTDKKQKHRNTDQYRGRDKQYQSKRDHGRSYRSTASDHERYDSSKHRSKEVHNSESRSSRKHQDEQKLKIKSHKSSGSRYTEDKKDSDSDLSPARNHPQSGEKREKSNSRAEVQERMQDGKKSGLQDAKHLKEELKRLKANEDKMFKKMDPSVLGATAAPIQRDRKTGMVRHIEKEKEEERAKAEKRAQTENKYYKWGKGLKQIQDQEDRIADAIQEMSKPLARYRDDKDLDAYLRSQEREGDPMLAYIRNKQAESHNVIDLTAGSKQPIYNGSYMPNRFGIRPGYRWDGVDRSNGYEKKWFEQKNARKAIEEAAYKWSTSDM